MFDSLFVYLSHAHADTSCLIKLTEPNEMSALCYYWDCSFLTPDIVAKFHVFVHIWCVKVFDSINLNDFEWHNQWCSGKYLFGGTHGQRGARAYNGVWGQSPQRGPGAEPLAGVRGRSQPEAEKVLRFGHAMETANLPNKLQLSLFWKLSKPLLFVISLQNWGAIAAVESRCKATVYAVKNFSCWTAPIWGMNRYSRQQGNRAYNFLVRCAI